MIQKEYEDLKKKYNLPSYEAFNKEFEIQALEIKKCGLFYKALLRTILNKLLYFINTLEPIVSPNPQSVHSMIEASNLTDQDKQEIFSFYKELSYLYHKGSGCELENEKEIIAFIKEIWEKWANIKKKQRQTSKKITQTWIENAGKNP